ncbi:hypothetical protein JOM56_015227 [Amanita muscaria]
MDDDAASIPLKDYEPVIKVIIENSLSIVEFITALLTEKRFKSHALTKELLQNSETVLVHLLGHEHLPETAQNQACALVERIYAHEIRELVLHSSGWHFSAQQATPQDLEDFCLDKMSVEYLKTAPRIWSLLDALLSVRTRRRSSLLLEPNRMTTGENLGGHWTGDNRDEQRLEGTFTRRTDSTSPDTESSKKEN